MHLEISRLPNWYWQRWGVYGSDAILIWKSHAFPLGWDKGGGERERERERERKTERESESCEGYSRFQNTTILTCPLNKSLTPSWWKAVWVSHTAQQLPVPVCAAVHLAGPGKRGGSNIAPQSNTPGTVRYYRRRRIWIGRERGRSP